MDVSYRITAPGRCGEAGGGRIVDLSSSGVRFTGGGTLEVGMEIDVSVPWPLTLDCGTPLQLAASGTVVRVGTGEAAVRFKRYEFRTRRRTPTA